MRSIRITSLALAVVLLAPAALRAQAISFAGNSPMSPKGVAGTIQGNGKFTVDAKKFKLIDVRLIMILAQGKGGETDCMVDQTNMTWGGMVSGLGQNTTYQVVARIRLVNLGTGEDEYFFTDLVPKKADGSGT